MAFPWGPDSMGLGQSPPRGLTPTTVMTDSPRPLVSTERDAATGAIAVCWDSDRTGVAYEGQRWYVRRVARSWAANWAGALEAKGGKVFQSEATIVALRVLFFLP